MLNLFLYLEACVHILLLLSQREDPSGVQAYTEWLERQGIQVTATTLQDVATGLAVARWDGTVK